MATARQFDLPYMVEPWDDTDSHIEEKPRRSGCQPGLLGFRVQWGVKRAPHARIVLQPRLLQRVLVITVQCKTRKPKREAPRGD